MREESRARHGNALRAGVLGSTDGLVSNLSLVAGVAGAGAPHQAIVVAGVAGLVVERVQAGRLDEIVDKLGGLSMTLDDEALLEVTRSLFDGRYAFKQRAQMLGRVPA